MIFYEIQISAQKKSSKLNSSHIIFWNLNKYEFQNINFYKWIFMKSKIKKKMLQIKFQSYYFSLSLVLEKT